MIKEKQYQEWIRQMFKKYQPILFLDPYHLKLKKVKDNYLASKFNYPYLDIDIEYSDESIKDWVENKKDAERRMIHEFCHTITDTFYNVSVDRYCTKSQMEDARERLTDHIAQIVNKHFNLI